MQWAFRENNQRVWHVEPAYLDRETGELMWLVDASDEKHWWKVASPNLYEAVYELGVLVGVEWEE